MPAWVSGKRFSIHSSLYSMLIIVLKCENGTAWGLLVKCHRQYTMVVPLATDDAAGTIAREENPAEEDDGEAAGGHVKVLTFYDDDPLAQHSFAIGTDQNITQIAEAFRLYNMTSFWAIPGSGISGGKPMGVWVRGKHGKL